MVTTRSRDTIAEAVIAPAVTTEEEEEGEVCVVVKVVESPTSSIPTPPAKNDGISNRRRVAAPITPPPPPLAEDRRSLMVASSPAQQHPPSIGNDSNDNRPKVLCLGMSYASMERQLRYYNVDPNEWLGGRDTNVDITVQDVLNCVKEGMLTEMDARDLARCVATEIAANVKVYTVSQEKAALYDNERHLFANFNRHSFLHQLHMAFATNQDGNLQPQQGDDDNSSNSNNNNIASGRRRRSFHAEYNILYRQAILDYFWIPQGWDDHHWSRSFFADILPDLVKQGMLEIQVHQQKDAAVPCGVYLPFCFHCFRQIVNALPILRQYYAISFLRKRDLHEVSLWKGTRTIDRESMCRRLGKDLEQEDIYCTFGYQEVMQAGTNARDEPKEMLVDILSRLEDFKEIRMIKLRPLRQHHPSINLPKDQYERGGLVGLVDPKTVKRGFMATEPSKDSKNTTARKAAITTTTTTTKSLKRTPSTPRATKTTKSTTTPKSAGKAITARKRGQPPAGAATITKPSTKRRKKAPTLTAAASADCLSPSAKKALFPQNRSRLGMPTRSRTRAFAALSPPPTGPMVPLLDQNSTAPPRRSSRRNITFVALPNNPPTRKRRQSKSSSSVTASPRETEEAPSLEGENCEGTTAEALAKLPGNESKEAPMHENSSKSENYDTTKPASTVSTTKKEMPTNRKTSEVVITAVPPKEAGALNPAPTTNALDQQFLHVSPPVAATSSRKNHIITDGATAPHDDVDHKGQEANSIPAVTPSPATSVAKATRARSNKKAAAKPIARRALAFADAGETKPRVQQLDSHENASERRRSGRKRKEVAKEQVQSVLLTIPEQEPTEVSDTSSSVSESSEVSSPLVSVERAVKQYNSSRSSVLETLPPGDTKGPNEIVKSTILVDSDSELSDIGMGNPEPGLTTQERLECLEKQLSPSSRISAPSHATNRSSGPKAGENRKAHTSSRVKKASPKLPDSSKARRQEWKARRKGGRLNRRGTASSRRRNRAAQPQSVLMLLFDSGV